MLDTEGAVVATSDVRPTLPEVEAVLPRFTGEIEQVPPVYSALKVEGKRAYDRARAGEAVELAPRRVTIHALALANERTSAPVESAFASSAGRPDPYDPSAPLELADSVTLVAHVSKGTYIRSLARDIARALGTVGHVTYLRRTKAGPFAEAQAIPLDLLNEIGKGARLEDHLLPLEAGLDGIPAHPLDPESAQAARQGRVVSGHALPNGLFLGTAGGIPVALMESDGATAKVVRGFNLPDTAKDET